VRSSILKACECIGLRLSLGHQRYAGSRGFAVGARHGLFWGVLVPLFGPLVGVVSLIFLFGERRPLSLVRPSLPSVGGVGVQIAPPFPPAAVATPDVGRAVGAPAAGTKPESVGTQAPGTATSTVQSATSAPLRTLLDERFIEAPHGWPHDPGATAWFSGGTYRLFVRGPEPGVVIDAPVEEMLDDVLVTATFRKASGPVSGGYGVIVRNIATSAEDGARTMGRYFLFQADDRGEVGIWRRDEQRWVDLVPWTPSTAVRPGDGANELTVRAMGPRLTFLVNGTQVAEVEDPAPSRGRVGIFAGGLQNEVIVERVSIQLPDRP